jgi:hypothetical protein
MKLDQKRFFCITVYLQLPSWNSSVFFTLVTSCIFGSTALFNCQSICCDLVTATPVNYASTHMFWLCFQSMCQFSFILIITHTVQHESVHYLLQAAHLFPIPISSYTEMGQSWPPILTQIPQTADTGPISMDFQLIVVEWLETLREGLYTVDRKSTWIIRCSSTRSVWLAQSVERPLTALTTQ